jgi:hypothetical protein
MFAVLATVVVTASAFAAVTSRPKRPALPTKAKAARIAALRHVNPVVTRRLRSSTWRWQSLMGLRRTRALGRLDTRRALLYWRVRARTAQRLAARPPHRSGWLCIHRFEGSWTDGNDPYWGGLQMDRGFMLRYAPRHLLRRGWANRWTPLEQMWVAERAHRAGRGFWPWPNTARACGLL